MNDRKFLGLASALAVPTFLALALTGCGRSSKDQTAADLCPAPFSVQDAQSLTRFAPGASHDPRNVVFEAGLTNATSSCSLGKNQMEITLILRVAVNAGPAATPAVSVPYFVRMLDASGTIVQGQEFNADFKLSKSNPRGQSQEELTLRIPFTQPGEVASYRIAVGLKPTPEELQYNRSGAAAR